ncbi:MAG: hypothetical protein H5T59_05725 [Anaerolineae bacterium]|nr:hypothetical protein [Anaerolineae bacterium]
MKKGLIVFLAVVLLAAVAGGAFYAGMQVGKNQAQQQMAQLARQRFAAMQQGGQLPSATPGAPQGGRAFGAGGGLMGTVKAIQGDSLVLTTEEDEVQVRVTENTLIRKTMNVALQDLVEGERVIVSGTRAQDGTVTARAIQSVQFLGPGPEPTAQP